MRTIAKEFTKEQLIEQAKKNIEVLRGAVEKIPGASDAAVIHLKLARIALASLEAEPIGFAFADDVDLMRKKIKVGGMLTVRNQGEVALYSAPPAPANAEPVAWLWSHRKHPSEVSLVRPEDDERADGAHWSGWSCQALYAAPQVPVSVPDDVSGPLAHAYKELTPTFMRNHIGVFERYGIYPDGSAGIQAMRIALDGMNRRASMLHGAENAESPTTMQTAPSLDSSQIIAESPSGNSPVIPDGWVACSERMPEEGQEVIVMDVARGKVQSGMIYEDGCFVDFSEQYYEVENPSHWMPLPAAPQQELKP